MVDTSRYFIYSNTHLTQESFGLEIWMQTKTLLIPSAKLTFDTKFKLMVEARYAIYSKILFLWLWIMQFIVKVVCKGRPTNVDGRLVGSCESL